MGNCVSHTISEELQYIPNPDPVAGVVPHEHHHTPNPNAAVAVVGVGVVPREHHKLKDFIPPALLVYQSGSTDESFFDAQSWIESEHDDEFYSINGDHSPSPGISHIHRRFSTGTPLVLAPSPLISSVPRLVKVNSTPSRINTPLNIIFAAGTPQSNEPEIFPVDKKMRLLELFRLSRGGFADERFLFGNKSVDTKTSYSSKRTSNASSKRRRSIKAVHPIDCLRKLRTGRHKNQKKMIVDVVGEQGHKVEGNVVEV